MIKRIVLITSVFLLLLVPSAVVAEENITVIASDVDVDFPDQAVFTLEAAGNMNIVDVRLCYQVERLNYAEVVSEGWADFTPATSVEANWVWNMMNSSLPPGAEVIYWWLIEDADGNKLETSPEIVHFDDQRYSWQSLHSTTPEGSEISLFWYEGSNSFASELMDTCEEALTRLTQDIGTYPEKPIKIYVYASSDDLKGALIYPWEWTGGVAFTAFSTIAIGISPSALDWGTGAMVHELTHLVVHQATFSPYGQLPLWLDEGLAMYNEGELDATLSSYLEDAIAKDELISVRSLCSPFSAYTDKASLSYAQSYSLAKYLLDNYGQESMLDLLTIFKQGSTYNEALTEVYGFDIDGLDTRWRATLSASTIIDSEENQSSTPMIIVLAVLGTTSVLWFRRKSFGKSTIQDKL